MKQQDSEEHREWTQEEMEQAEPLPMPEVPDDDESPPDRNAAGDK